MAETWGPTEELVPPGQLLFGTNTQLQVLHVLASSAKINWRRELEVQCGIAALSSFIVTATISSWNNHIWIRVPPVPVRERGFRPDVWNWRCISVRDWGSGTGHIPGRAQGQVGLDGSGGRCPFTEVLEQGDLWGPSQAILWPCACPLLSLGLSLLRAPAPAHQDAAFAKGTAKSQHPFRIQKAC